MITSINYSKYKWLILILTLSLTACDLIEYHPYEYRFKNGKSNINQTNITRIEASDNNNDTIRFAFMGDTQRHYDETADFVKDINQRNNIDFVIHGGDITDFGLTKEYLWIHDIMDELQVPYLAVIGNHDLISHGKDGYKQIYGDFNFAFKFRKTRFICLNTNALELEDKSSVPDYDFMSGFISDTIGIEKTIVVMHAPPYDVQFNNDSIMRFKNILENYNQLLFCLHAHGHKQTVNQYFNNGITFYSCDDISGRNYLLFTIIKNTYTYKVVYF